MFASIDDFLLADGTLQGGYALGELRISVTRVADIVIPLGSDPTIYDRNIRKTTLDFQVARIHATFEAADKYVADHDTLVPSSGPVALYATDGTIYGLIDAAVIQHQRVGGIGKTTIHSYHIEGGRLVFVAGPPPEPPPPWPPPPPPPPPFGRFIIEEDSDYILLESGGRIKTEQQ